MMPTTSVWGTSLNEIDVKLKFSGNKDWTIMLSQVSTV